MSDYDIDVLTKRQTALLRSFAVGEPVDDPDWPRTRARKRVGRCYELAFNAFLKLPPDTGWSLIHGEVNGLWGSRIGHAWLQRPGLIWDPVEAMAFAEGGHIRRSAAVEMARYSSQKEAANKMLSHNHLGPWHNE